LGTKKVNDINFDQIGRLSEVSSTGKVKQMIIKALLTSRGNNPDQPNYGSTLQDAIGQQFLPTAFIQIQQTIQDTINRLIDIQNENIDITPPDELILGLDDLQVDPDSTDPRKVNVKLTVVVGDYEKLTIPLNINLGAA
jgi:phage baseplate assembly protein W